MASLLNEMGWEALAGLRLRRLEQVNAENERLRAVLESIEDIADEDGLHAVERLNKIRETMQRAVEQKGDA